ncbi:uncharacterized protein LOC110032167 [Phalaenopsis equestris]|uniref:uncharacterized protein LOC110032167 n=1 Tax=Phalaenopsis equestris TaxID=78828 RepID=UPI0009E2A331|nr:uncharacterized protein LOC110032167 [Phalaenopsis equestris]
MGIDHTEPLIKLSLHHLKTSKALRNWGWETFGNVFSNAISAEKEVERLEAAVQNNAATETELLTTQTNLNKVIDIQDMLLKLKASINIFTEGDRNTKWLNDNELIAKDVVMYYSSLLNSSADLISDYEDYFTEESSYTSQLNLTELPSDEEIWEALNTIDSSKAAGLDGFTADFYKKARHIIKKEVVEAIRSFFSGANLSSYFVNTSIVLTPVLTPKVTPKEDLQKTWEHFNPISLTSFISKLINKKQDHSQKNTSAPSSQDYLSKPNCFH